MPENYTLAKYDDKRRDGAWTRVNTFETVDSAIDFFTTDGVSWANTPSTKARLTTLWKEVSANAAAIRNHAGQPFVSVDRAGRQGYVSLFNYRAKTVLVWPFPVDAVDPLKCFQRLAALAGSDAADYRLSFSLQEDQAFMWKAPLVHPMQVRENAYQRVVLAAGRAPDTVDPNAAQSEALARYFVQDAAVPAPMVWRHMADPGDPRWAAVRMNHLIDSFYLFRLLVRYELHSTKPIEDELRIELSGALTKLLQNGDRQNMGWLSVWLAAKIADLGRRIKKISGADGPRVIFFLKGGRALNYFLGTPEKGENDWDTQVVIDPRLPATEWYSLFSKVHDELLTALREYNEEFAQLVTEHADMFDAYLEGIPGPKAVEDEETDENEVSDVASREDHAGCKAELIDVGLPRRDSPSALEEWNRLSAEGALLDKDGVIVPHRPYYVNEYLMLVRQAFLPHAEVHKAPKRAARFALLLASDNDGSEQSRRLLALPNAVKQIKGLASAARRELYYVIATQFAEAYSLLHDTDLADVVDTRLSKLIAAPPELPTELAKALKDLTDDQRTLAKDVGVAHALSDELIKHSVLRGRFVSDNARFFDTLLLALQIRLDPILADNGAQFAITGSYAASLHADQLKLPKDGLEPVRRILVQLQCPAGTSEADIMNRVRDAALEEVAAQPSLLEQIPLDANRDPKERSLSLRWTSPVDFADGLSYRPHFLKIRGAAQASATLPPLESIRGLRVLDVRYLAADYLRKSAKTDESGMRAVLAKANGAILEMMSQFDITSVVVSDADDTNDL